ncbi:MAG: tetratricopeptide repeat protein [Neomegalonema sp.]|nr:tetratricopeptide repeat protein [Neomegalonema sp.]
MATAEQAQKLYNDALEFQKAGKHRQAAKLYHRLLDMAPGHPVALTNLAICYGDMGQYDKALPLLKNAIRAKPGDWIILNALGACFYRLGQAEEALRALEASIAHKPDNLEAAFYAGLALEQLERWNDAVGALTRAAGPNRDNAPALKELARLQARLGDREAEAEAALAAWRAAPDRLAYNVTARFAAQQIADWGNYDALDAGFEDKAAAADPRADYLGEPFNSLSRTESRAVERRLGESRSAYLIGALGDAKPYTAYAARKPGAPLRVGYLSADFHDHATMHLMAGVFREHDPNAVLFYCYSYGPDDAGPYRQLLLERAEGFRELRALTAAEAAAVIHQDQLDLLIDLKGHTQDARLEICALRPAPVQASYLGYPGTLGADFIDYAITDEIVAPDAHANDFSEVLAHHPVCYQPNDDAQAVEPTPSRAELGLPEEGVVFCSFNQIYKLDPVRFGAWMEVLRRVDGAVLWLLQGSEQSSAALKAHAEAAGIAAERLIFAPRVAKAAHLGRLRAADLALDTRVYNGHTTTTDALSVGVPVLATIGDHFASRVSASILTALGVDALIAKDEADFIERAVALASDREAVVALKEQLAEAQKTRPLFDSRRYTKDLERLYAALAERGASPQNRAPIRI